MNDRVILSIVGILLTALSMVLLVGGCYGKYLMYRNWCDMIRHLPSLNQEPPKMLDHLPENEIEETS